MQKIDKTLMSNRTQEQTGNPPVAKPLPSRWIPEDNPLQRVNVSLI